MAEGFKIADAYVEVHADTRGVEGDVDRQTRGGGILTGVGGKLATGMAAGFAAVGIGKLFSGFIKDAAEAAALSRITENVIKTTGGAANVTAGQIEKLAGAIASKTGIDDAAIQNGQNLLLTFTNLRNEAGAGNDIFNQATSIMTDMSVALGTDASGSAIQLGKALNDPVKGVTALTKVGVSFTDQQKEQIKTLVASGDTLGAQKIILQELQKEFGGTAEAAADPMKRLKFTLGEIGESIGAGLLPILNTTATFIVTSVIPALSNIGHYVGIAGGAFAAMAGFIQSNSTIFSIIVGIIAAVFLPGLIAMGITATATGVKVVASWIAQQAAAIAAAAAHSAAVAKQVVAWVLLGVQAMLAAAKVAAAWLISMGPIGLVIAAVVGLVALIVIHFDTIKRVIGIAWDWVRDKTSQVWDAIKSGLSAAWNFIKAVIEQHVANVRAVISTLGALPGMVIGFFDRIRGGIADKLGDAVGFCRSIPGRIIGALGDTGGMLYDSGVRIIQGLINGIRNMAGRVKDAISNVLSGARRLLPFSPAKEGPFSGKGWTTFSGASMVTGLAEGMKSAIPSLMSATGSVVDAAQIGAGAPSLAGASGGTFGSTTSSTSSVSVGNLHLHIDGTFDLTDAVATRSLIKKIRDGLVSLESETK